MTDRELIDHVNDLEHRVRFWKSIALGMTAALSLLVAVGTLAAVLFFSRASAQREEAAVEVEMNQLRALQAVQEAEVQRNRAERAVKKK